MQSNVIAVVFHETDYRKKHYHYFCQYPVKVGDHVVVESPCNGYTCVKVVEVITNTAGIKATKPVVQVVDDSDYRANLNRVKRLAELKVELKRRAQEHSEIEFYKRLAELDPSVKELVAEYQSLAA